MGILDSVIGQLGAHGMPGTTAGAAEALMAFVNQPQVGGISGIVERLRQNGLAGAVDSWLAPGPNEPVSGDQVANALGPDAISHVAVAGGMDHGHAAETLAQLLPVVIEHFGRQGGVAGATGTQSGPEGMLGEAMSLFGQKR